MTSVIENVFDSIFFNQWPEIRERMGYPSFYDSLFEYERNKYNSYLNNYQAKYFDSELLNLIHSKQQPEFIKPIIQEIKKYICEKTGINKVTNECEQWTLTEPCIKEFLYFNKTPSFIVKNLLETEPEYYPDILTLDGEKYKYSYFIWRREGDPNIRRADKNEIVTPENFKNYSRFDTIGWSVKQLRTFFRTHILPILLQKCNIKINTDLPNYKKIIDNVSIKQSLNVLIDEYIRTNTIPIDMNNVSKIKMEITRLSNNLEDVSPYDITKDMRYHFGLYNFIAALLIQRGIVQKSLQQKIINIRTRIEKKQSTEFKYKWQQMCAKLTKWDIEQLRELAVIENIPNYQIKSKRELCKEFEEILQRKIDDHRRQMIRYIPDPEKPSDAKDTQLNELFERHIQNNLTPNEQRHKQRYPQQYSQKCQNNDSLLGDSLTDIKPEFFFTYKHNNKIFCDDIRILYDQVIKRQEINNPYDRTPLSQEVIRSIEKTYNKLKDTMLSLKDEENEQPVPLQSILTSKTTDLLALFFHHAPMENFIYSDEIAFTDFVMYLKIDSILSEREAQYIMDLPDLQSQKIGLVDLLTMKIRNDENVIDGFSSMASSITDIYNNVFTDQLDSPIPSEPSPTESSPTDESSEPSESSPTDESSEPSQPSPTGESSEQPFTFRFEDLNFETDDTDISDDESYQPSSVGSDDESYQSQSSLTSDEESEISSPTQSNSQQESDNIVIQRKAIVFISNLTNVPDINYLNIIRTNSQKIADFIRYLIEANILNAYVLYEWTQTGLLSQEGVLIETNLPKLKIKLLEKLIEIIQDTPNTAETISNIIRTHNIFN